MTNQDLKHHKITPLYTRVFRVGDGAVIAFFDPAAESERESLPGKAVLLPERMPRTRANRAGRIGRALALTPITLTLDAIGTAFFVPAAVVLNPRYATNMIVWVNTDTGEFPPPLLFLDKEK